MGLAKSSLSISKASTYRRCYHLPSNIAQASSSTKEQHYPSRLVSKILLHQTDAVFPVIVHSLNKNILF